MKHTKLAGYLPLPEADDNALKVNNNLEMRLQNLIDKGFVDCKAMCSPDRNSSSADKLWVLNNVLRQYESGMCEVEIIEA